MGEVSLSNSALVWVMAWCRQATSHCLSQCWPRSLSPYDVTRPKWVNCHSLTLLNMVTSHFLKLVLHHHRYHYHHYYHHHYNHHYHYHVTSQNWVINKVNPGYFSLAATARKLQQLSMFLHISARGWGRRWSPHTSEQKGSMLKLW